MLIIITKDVPIWLVKFVHCNQKQLELIWDVFPVISMSKHKLLTMYPMIC